MPQRLWCCRGVEAGDQTAWGDGQIVLARLLCSFLCTQCAAERLVEAGGAHGSTHSGAVPSGAGYQGRADAFLLSLPARSGSVGEQPRIQALYPERAMMSTADRLAGGQRLAAARRGFSVVGAELCGREAADTGRDDLVSLMFAG